MIENIMQKFLSEKLDIDVYTEEPERPPPEYLIIAKAGSSDGAAHSIMSAVMTVQSYAAALFNAAQLNERVKKAVFEMPQLDEICSVRCNSDYNFTDEDTHRYRYQAVFEIHYYAD